MINFTGVRLSKYNTELELPVDTTDLDDLKNAEFVIDSFFRLTENAFRLASLCLNSIARITTACFLSLSSTRIARLWHW